MTQSPPANLPIYSTATPNHPVLLYTGPATCTNAVGAEALGEAVLELRWSPTPRLHFELVSDDDSRFDLLNPGTLHIADRDTTLDAFLTGVSLAIGTHTQQTVTGIAEGNIGAGPINSVVGHVVNGVRLFGASITDGAGTLWRGRSSWASRSWSLVLDEVASLGGLQDALRSDGGFAITHSATIESNGGSIDIDSSGILFAVCQFLTFLRGEFVGLALPVGRDHRGGPTWERWVGPRAEPWTSRKSCFPDHIILPDSTVRQPDLAAVFDRFAEHWHDPEWSELLRVGVSQYALANSLSNAEAKVVLSQATLELCAWLWLVPANLSRDGFERLTASDRIRLLLSAMRQVFDIPRALPNLSAFATTTSPEKQVWDDGPRALTEIRNLITHPQKRLRPADIDIAIWVEVGQLAIWYVELALMFLLGYQDIYLNRAASWVREPVPWIALPSEPDPPHFPPLLTP